MNTLYVENHAQQVLFQEELKGQISDGMWENARPHDHWHAWCDAEVKIDKDNPGIDFDRRPSRQRYNFASAQLLEVVGERMLSYVRIARVIGYGGKNYKAACECYLDMDGKFREEIPKYVTVADRKVGESLDVEVIRRAVSDESLYDMRQMRKDLRRLGQIIKITRK